MTQAFSNKECRDTKKQGVRMVFRQLTARRSLNKCPDNDKEPV